MEKQISVRLFQQNDLQEVARIYAEAFNKAFCSEKWTTKIAEKYMLYWFEQQKDLFFVATLNNKILGGTVGKIKPLWEGNDLSELELFVDPKKHHQGAGKLLLKTIIESASEKYQIVNVEGVADGRKSFPLDWYNKIGIRSSGWIHIMGNAKEILKEL